MAWGILLLCLWITKHYSELEYSNILTSNKVSIIYMITHLAYRIGFIILVFACIASLFVAVGFSVGYFGTYYP